jgi:hypothetical protein
MNSLLDKIAKKYPFLTVCRYVQDEYVGIIMNQSSDVTTMYDFGNIANPRLKKLFLELGEVWWWESQRSIPINLYLKQEWEPFKPYLKTFTNKNLEILIGPCTSIADLGKTKKKKRSVTLVRRVT